MNTAEGARARGGPGHRVLGLKAPKYANIDYTDFYSEKMDKAFAAFPETDLRFVIKGTDGPRTASPACC